LTFCTDWEEGMREALRISRLDIWNWMEFPPFQQDTSPLKNTVPNSAEGCLPWAESLTCTDVPQSLASQTRLG
jgi:hypothetical protein